MKTFPAKILFFKATKNEVISQENHEKKGKEKTISLYALRHFWKHYERVLEIFPLCYRVL